MAKKAKKAAKKLAKKVTKRDATKAVPKVAKKAIKKVARKAVTSVMAKGGVPAVGTKAPAFSLQSSEGTTIRLEQYAGKTVVLFFYPRADTPGCTREACGFSDTTAEFTKRGAVVLGVSPDPLKDVTKFAGKFSLKFPLLADADHAACEKYGVWVEKSMYGKKYMGAARTTFVIDGTGTISSVFEKVQPDGHEKEVLAALRR